MAIPEHTMPTCNAPEPTLPPELRARIGRSIKQNGLKATAARLGVGVATCAALALQDATVRPGSIALALLNQGNLPEGA